MKQICRQVVNSHSDVAGDLWERLWRTEGEALRILSRHHQPAQVRCSTKAPRNDSQPLLYCAVQVRCVPPNFSISSLHRVNGLPLLVYRFLGIHTVSLIVHRWSVHLTTSMASLSPFLFIYLTYDIFFSSLFPTWRKLVE